MVKFGVLVMMVKSILDKVFLKKIEMVVVGLQLKMMLYLMAIHLVT